MTDPGKAIFISYSHNDERWLHRLQVHLAPLVRRRAIEVWSDKRIEPGVPWRADISKALERAEIAILLVSPEFLASEFIAQNELPRLLTRARREGIRILWLAISHSMYTDTPIAEYQALNDPKRPLRSLRSVDADKVLVRACETLRNASGKNNASSENTASAKNSQQQDISS